MRAYKVFNSNWTCRGFEYEVGKTYKHNGDVEVCGSGFHACKKVVDCFSYYDFNPKNKIAEVELLGEVKTEGGKSACSEIKIVREISWQECLEIVNTGEGNTGNRNSGNRNSGNRNSGNRNSGDRSSGNSNSGDSNSGDSNSGYWNSGNRNSGNWNSGDWNSCDYESGFFNSETSDEIRIFNKLTNISNWNKCKKPSFIYFDLDLWICLDEMTEEEKKANPESLVTDGYLKSIDYKEAWRKSWDNAKTKNDWEVEFNKLISLPNFDKEVFKEISGINIDTDK